MDSRYVRIKVLLRYLFGERLRKMIETIIILSVIVVILGIFADITVHKNKILAKALEAEAEKVDKLEADKTDLKKTIASQAIELEGYRPIGKTIEQASQRAKELEGLVDSASKKLQGLKDDISTEQVILQQKKVESEKLDAEIAQQKTKAEKAKADCRAVIDRLRELQGLENSSEVLDNADAITTKIAQIDEILKAIKVDWEAAVRLKYSFNSRPGTSVHNDAYVIGLDVNGLMVVAYGFSYRGGRFETDCMGGPYINMSSFDAGWEKLVSNPDVVTWVVIGMKKNGKSFSFMNKIFAFHADAKVISAELTEAVKGIYSGNDHITLSGRFAMLDDKKTALETKRATLVGQLDALNAEAAATVGVDAVLAD